MARPPGHEYVQTFWKLPSSKPPTPSLLSLTHTVEPLFNGLFYRFINLLTIVRIMYDKVITKFSNQCIRIY